MSNVDAFKAHLFTHASIAVSKLVKGLTGDQIKAQSSQLAEKLRSQLVFDVSSSSDGYRIAKDVKGLDEQFIQFFEKLSQEKNPQDVDCFERVLEPIIRNLSLVRN